MNTVRETKLYSSYLYNCNMGLTNFLYKTQGLFCFEVHKASGFDHPNPSRATLKVLTSELPISLVTCFQYYIVIFNIGYGDDNYYYDIILRVRSSHARHLFDLFFPGAISSWEGCISIRFYGFNNNCGTLENSKWLIIQLARSMLHAIFRKIVWSYLQEVTDEFKRLLEGATWE